MNFISKLLDEGVDVGGFKSNVLPIIRYVLFFLVVVCAIVMIVTILMQSNDADGSMDVLSGSQESYYSQNKGSSRDGKLKIITIVMASIIILSIIAYCVTLIFSHA